jgi:probable addiction module antidote protein
MPKRAKKYEEGLLKSLKNPEEAVAYLNTHLEDDSDDAEELFLMALRDVAKAHGFGDVADRADLGRESLYKALSESGNPKLTTLRSFLKAMGMKLTVEAEKRKAS